MPRFKAILFLLCFSTTGLIAQTPSDTETTDLQQYFQFDNPHPLACLFTYIPSIYIQHELELKDFVRSKTFTHLRHQFGDAKSVDAIYIRAMQLTNNNTAMALLLSTTATFDHDAIGLKIPVFNIMFPLTSETMKEFKQRVANLPSIIYNDSPPSGDHDKLQHFFGSAFLTYISESRQAADRFGVFVEKGEQEFIIGGMYDDRDLRADWQGQNFGYALLNNNRRHPSKYFTDYPRPLKADLEPFSCEGS